MQALTRRAKGKRDSRLEFTQVGTQSTSLCFSKSVYKWPEARARWAGGRGRLETPAPAHPPGQGGTAVAVCRARTVVALQFVRLLCSQILLGHPPPYTVDVTAPAPSGPTPAAVLSAPVPEGLPPAVPEHLPQLPSSQAPAPMAATPSLPVQATALPPANLPLTSGPGLSGLSSAVQLTVDLAPEVCGPGLPQGTLMPALCWSQP